MSPVGKTAQMFRLKCDHGVVSIHKVKVAGYQFDCFSDSDVGEGKSTRVINLSHLGRIGLRPLHRDRIASALTLRECSLTKNVDLYEMYRRL